MAEDRDKKPAAPKIVTAEIVAVALAAYAVFWLINAFVTGEGLNSSLIDSLKRQGAPLFFNSAVATYGIFASILSVLFIIGITYALIRLRQLEKRWRQTLYPEPTAAIEEPMKNERWPRVMEHIGSSNPSDWRLAILECDIILDDLLDKLGFVGGTIGDRLKNADPAHFRTLDSAWEAHKIRNAIAHEGQDFTLTQREARRIIGLYETVFQEFDFI